MLNRKITAVSAALHADDMGYPRSLATIPSVLLWALPLTSPCRHTLASADSMAKDFDRRHVVGAGTGSDGS